MINYESTPELARERALYLYTNAIEKGDFDTVAAVWGAAESDAVLEQMLLELEQELQASMPATQIADSEAIVTRLVEQHFGDTSARGEEPTAPPPVTVADVAARLYADPKKRIDIEKELPAIRQMRNIDVPVTDNLSLKGIRQLFSNLGIVASDRAQRLFRETAILLSMGQRQGQLRMAATRRQRTSGKHTTSKKTDGKGQEG